MILYGVRTTAPSHGTKLFLWGGLWGLTRTGVVCHNAILVAWLKISPL